MSAKTIAKTHRPHLIVGAGELISHVQRLDLVSAEHKYQFNLFRVCGDGQASHWLRPEDLRDIVKACQVLAFSIADDGWADVTLNHQLFELAEQLQQLTDSWEHNHG